MEAALKDGQYRRFCAYGFLKNLRFFEAFLLLFLLDQGLKYVEIGTLYALREIITHLAEVPSGVAADAFGRRRALAFSFLCYMLSFLGFYWAPGFGWLIVPFAFYGLGEAFRSGTHKGMIMDYLRAKGWAAHKVAYYGRTRSWSHLGSALSALLAGVILFYDGVFANIFLFTLVPYALNLILILSYPSWLDQPATPNQHPQQRLRQTWRSFLQATRQRAVLRIMTSSALHSAYLKAVKDYLQPMLKQLVLALPVLVGFSVEQRTGLFIGLVFTGIYVLSSQASVWAGRWQDPARQWGVAHRTLLLGLLAGVGCGLAVAASWWGVGTVLFIGLFLVENFRKPILTGLVADHSPGAVLTSVLSAQSLFKTLITAGVAIGLGALSDLVGLGAGLATVSGTLLLLAWLISGPSPARPEVNT